MDRPVLTLVLPARNEAALIGATVSRVSAYLQQVEPRHEILVGDSASTDGTGEIVRAAGVPRVRVIRAEEPGKGRILTRCLEEARGSVVGFLDADLEIPVETVGRLLMRIRDGADAAIATKSPPTDTGRPVPRRIGTWAFNAVVSRLFRSPLADHQAGCKLFRSRCLRPHLPLVGSPHWLWDTEILVRLLRAGARVDQVPCEPRPTRPTRVRYRDLASSMAGLATLWYRLGPRPHPMATPRPERVEVRGIHG